MEDSGEKIQLLKKYFNERDDIMMAFLFGSRAQGTRSLRAGSDWDIAVYFCPLSAQLEWEATDREYPNEQAVWRDISDILESDNVDLLVLNRAPAGIAETAIGGMQLVVKDS